MSMIEGLKNLQNKINEFGILADSADFVHRSVKVIVPSLEFASTALRLFPQTEILGEAVEVARKTFKVADKFFKGTAWMTSVPDLLTSKGRAKPPLKLASKVFNAAKNVLDIFIVGDNLLGIGFLSQAALCVGEKLPIIEVGANILVIISSVFGILHDLGEDFKSAANGRVLSQRVKKWEHRQYQLGDLNLLDRNLVIGRYAEKIARDSKKLSAAKLRKEDLDMKLRPLGAGTKREAVEKQLKKVEDDITKYEAQNKRRMKYMRQLKKDASVYQTMKMTWLYEKYKMKLAKKTAAIKNEVDNRKIALGGLANDEATSQATLAQLMDDARAKDLNIGTERDVLKNLTPHKWIPFYKPGACEQRKKIKNLQKELNATEKLYSKASHLIRKIELTAQPKEVQSTALSETAASEPGDDNITVLLKYKVAKYKTLSCNNNLTRFRSWISIAANVAKIAGVCLGMFAVGCAVMFPWLTLPTALLILSAFGIFSYSLGLGKLLVEKLGPQMKKAPVLG